MPDSELPTANPSTNPEASEIGTVRATQGGGSESDSKTLAATNAKEIPAPEIPGYSILEVLGQGGMGIVYKALDHQLGREVAIKMVATGPVVTDATRARFQTEARAVALLQHSHIAQVYLADTIENRPYFVMEYIDGGPLSQKIVGEPQPPRYAAELVAKLAQAIDFSHGKNVIHRDLKPANVLLTQAGEPKIADFGLVKFLDSDSSSTKTGDILGTPSYMAPEQAGGVVKKIGPGCDIYSLGAILYELLTGRPPFRTPDPMQTVLLVLSEEPVAPRKLQPTVPRDLETVCLKCLEKTPAKRYATAGDLAADLQRFLSDEPIQARRVGRWERGVKWAKRRPGWASLIGVCVLGVISGVTAAFYHNRQMRSEIEKTTAQRDKARSLFTIGHNLAKSLIRDHLWRLARLSGSTPERERLANQLIRYLDDLSRFAEDDDVLLSDIADAFEQVAAVQGNPYVQNLGKQEEALRNYAKAREIWKRVAKARPDYVGPRLRDARCRGEMADIHFDQGRWDLAESEYEIVRKAMKELARKEPNDERIAVGIVEIQSRLGDVAESRGQLGKALSQFEKALALCDRLQPDTSVKRRIRILSHAQLHGAMAGVFLKRNDLKQADTHATAAMNAVKPLMADGIDDAAVLRVLSRVLMKLGDTYSTKRDQEKARSYYRPALKHSRALAKANPNDGKSQANLVRILERMGAAFQADKALKTQGHQKAAAHFLEALPVIERLAAKQTKNYDFVRTLGIIQRKLAESLLFLKRLEEGERLLRASLVSAERLASIQQNSPEPLIAKAEIHFSLAQLAIASTQRDASFEEMIRNHMLAIDECRKSLVFWKQLESKQPLKPNQVDLRKGVIAAKTRIELNVKKLRAASKRTSM